MDALRSFVRHATGLGAQDFDTEATTSFDSDPIRKSTSSSSIRVSDSETDAGNIGNRVVTVGDPDKASGDDDRIKSERAIRIMTAVDRQFENIEMQLSDLKKLLKGVVKV